MPEKVLPSETHYRLLKRLEADPNLSQRELSASLGISLGKVNYCLRALIEKGLVKAENFRRSNNKLAYTYVLTPHGIRRKAEITLSFLRRKQDEYEALQSEIEQLRAEVRAQRETGNLPDE